MSLWITICYIISFVTFEMQMLLVWFYFKRKSDMNTTIIDLINRDTLVLHIASFTTIYLRMMLSYAAEEMEYAFPTFIAWSLAVSSDLVSLICFTYYSIGIVARCFLVLKQRTCLSEDKTDEEARNIIRYITFTFGSVVTLIRTAMGQINQSFYAMTRTDVSDGSSLLTVLPVLSFAFVVNLVCRLLIARENKKLFKPGREETISKGYINTIWAIASWSVVLAVVVVFLYAFWDDPNKLHIVRICGAFSTLNALPVVYIYINKDFIEFLKKKIGLLSPRVSPQCQVP